MREIKFRGKDKINGKWHIGDLMTMQHFVAGEEGNYQISDFERSVVYEVEPKTIGQFTGVYDKNGKEIYEGDIFEIDDYTKGVVVYLESEGTFGIRCKYDEDDLNEPFSYYLLDEMEVLGNEYDNPELLGGWSNE